MFLDPVRQRGIFVLETLRAEADGLDEPAEAVGQFAVEVAQGGPRARGRRWAI